MTETARHPLGERHAQCTGCAACAATCPEQCIRVEPNAEGFLHPQINLDKCVDCDRCREVCPVSDSTGVEGNLRESRQVFAAWHLDEGIRRQSSSGGVFTALAQAVLAEGGVVVGAAFDETLVVRHVLIDSIADLCRLRGSKYVQSEVTPGLHRAIRGLLDDGRTVLFSGTPCQVAGLRSSLDGAKRRLVCCDIVCHGVPSPLLMAQYLAYNERNGSHIVDISFRDKSCGWKRPVVREHLASGAIKISDFLSTHPCTVAFLKNYALRECCYACPYTTRRRCGDLTIADFWGVGSRYPEYDPDDRGTSLVLINTPVGEQWLHACGNRLFLGVADIEAALPRNPMLTRSSERPAERDRFYTDLQTVPFSQLIRRYRLHRPSLWRRGIRQAKRKVNRYVRKVAAHCRRTKQESV